GLPHVAAVGSDTKDYGTVSNVSMSDGIALTTVLLGLSLMNKAILYFSILNCPYDDQLLDRISGAPCTSMEHLSRASIKALNKGPQHICSSYSPTSTHPTIPQT